MYVIVHSGTKKDRLKRRLSSLNRYVNKELRGPGEKGRVYDFKEWSEAKVKDRELGNDRNVSKFKESREIKSEFKKKGD